MLRALVPDGPGTTANQVDADRTPAYSASVSGIGDMQSCRLHSQMNSIVTLGSRSSLTSRIRSLTARKSASFLSDLDARGHAGSSLEGGFQAVRGRFAVPGAHRGYGARGTTTRMEGHDHRQSSRRSTSTSRYAPRTTSGRSSRSSPEFMQGVEYVNQIDDTHLRWKAEIGGTAHEWDAEITEQRPDERVAWKTTTGRATRRRDLPPARRGRDAGHGPDGLAARGDQGVGRQRARVRRPARKGDLERFKQVVESRGTESRCLARRGRPDRDALTKHEPDPPRPSRNSGGLGV